MLGRSGSIPTTSVRWRISRSRRSLGVVGPNPPPDLLRQRCEREYVGPGLFEVVGHDWELLGQGVDHPVELGGHRLGVGPVVDRVQQRLDPPPRVLRGTDIRFVA
jgi:hypothetical protein